MNYAEIIKNLKNLVNRVVKVKVAKIFLIVVLGALIIISAAPSKASYDMSALVSALLGRTQFPESFVDVSGNTAKANWVRAKTEVKRGQDSVGPYQLANKNIRKGSERVYVDGVRVHNNLDYDINYLTGNITFKYPLPVTSIVMVDYDYRQVSKIGALGLLDLPPIQLTNNTLADFTYLERVGQSGGKSVKDGRDLTIYGINTQTKLNQNPGSLLKGAIYLNKAKALTPELDRGVPAGASHFFNKMLLLEPVLKEGPFTFSGSYQYVGLGFDGFNELNQQKQQAQQGGIQQLYDLNFEALKNEAGMEKTYLRGDLPVAKKLFFTSDYRRVETDKPGHQDNDTTQYWRNNGLSWQIDKELKLVANYNTYLKASKEKGDLYDKVDRIFKLEGIRLGNHTSGSFTRQLIGEAHNGGKEIETEIKTLNLNTNLGNGRSLVSTLTRVEKENQFKQDEMHLKYNAVGLAIDTYRKVVDQADGNQDEENRLTIIRVLNPTLTLVSNFTRNEHDDEKTVSTKSFKLQTPQGKRYQLIGEYAETDVPGVPLKARTSLTFVGKPAPWLDLNMFYEFTDNGAPDLFIRKSWTAAIPLPNNFALRGIHQTNPINDGNLIPISQTIYELAGPIAVNGNKLNLKTSYVEKKDWQNQLTDTVTALTLSGNLTKGLNITGIYRIQDNSVRDSLITKDLRATLALAKNVTLKATYQRNPAENPQNINKIQECAKNIYELSTPVKMGSKTFNFNPTYMLVRDYRSKVTTSGIGFKFFGKTSGVADFSLQYNLQNATSSATMTTNTLILSYSRVINDYNDYLRFTGKLVDYNDHIQSTDDKFDYQASLELVTEF